MITDDLKIATRDLEHIPRREENRLHARHAVGLGGQATILALASGRSISSGKCRLVDASFGGVRIEIQHPGSEVTQAIDLKQCSARIAISGPQGEADVVFEGAIVWLAPAPLQGFVHFGLKFVGDPRVEAIEKLLEWTARAPTVPEPRRSARWPLALLLLLAVPAALYQHKASEADGLAAALARETEMGSAARAEAESLRGRLESCKTKVGALSAPVSVEISVAADKEQTRDVPSCTQPIEVVSHAEAANACAYALEGGEPVLLLELRRRSTEP